MGIETPAIYFIDGEKNLVVMEWINGPTAKNWISQQAEQLDEEKYEVTMQEFGAVLGLNLGRLHRGGLIHGDLTTSNMILKNGDPGRLALIDFGLSSQGKVSRRWRISHSCFYAEESKVHTSFQVTAEEKGVDLYVLERAVVSTHGKSSGLLKGLMKGYKTADAKQVCISIFNYFSSISYFQFVAVEKKLNEIRLRGRKRDMIG